ncbi:MAG: serine/threonine protein kinase [Chitinophagaceae bacterium]|nr:MAG: serine/threonine protein kinase [Chitinophagaceae bacterium]
MIGKQIQNYQVTAHLGQGGMGTVYRATDIILGREVALKMLHTPMMSQPQVLERFKKEAQVLARLLHPNIAVIYNLIEQDQQHFMVMEYVEGKDLEVLLRQHRVLPAMAVAAAFIQALEGLHHAHRKGIFHRDIKPSNLILTPDGTVKLMDFGIAKVAGEQRLTQVNRVIGTVEFLAPELIEGKDPSAASDVYAVGMTMYELLCGRLPFEHQTDFNLMQEILKKKPVSPDKLNASVPPVMAAIIMKSLEKKPENRFADARAFQSALAAAFPAAREADITWLFANAVVPLPVADNTAMTGTRELPKPSPGLRPAYLLRMLNLPARLGLTGMLRGSMLVPGLKRRIAGLDRRTVLIGLAMFAIVVTTVSLVLSRDKPLPEPGPVAEFITDKPSPVGENNTPVSLRPQTSDSSSGAPVMIGSVEDKPETTPVDDKKQDVKPETRKASGKEAPKEDEPKPVPAPAPDKPVEQTIVPVVEELKPRSSGSMVLGAKMEVSLYLRDALSENSQTGQALSFSVTSPVVYQGQVIIEKGSIATGRIKNVGNKKITVVLQNVGGLNGQRLPLQEIELSGRTNEMISNRSYSGYIKKGTVVSY